MLSPFGTWVRAFRQKREITLRNMARTLEVAPSFLSALELGRKSVPNRLIERFISEYDLQGNQMEEFKRSAESSITNTKMHFSNSTTEKEREVAMIFARNFEGLSDEKKERIRQILEEGDNEPTKY